MLDYVECQRNSQPSTPQNYDVSPSGYAQNISTIITIETSNQILNPPSPQQNVTTQTNIYPQTQNQTKKLYPQLNQKKNLEVKWHPQTQIPHSKLHLTKYH